MYGIVAILILLLLISSTIGIYYYFEYSHQSSLSSSFASELNAADLKYNQTVAQYNSVVAKYGDSLTSFDSFVALYNESVSTFNTLSSSFASLSTGYNRTLTLLVSAVSVLNTSDVVYQNASRSLTKLWASYNNLSSTYEKVVKEFQALFTTFQSSIMQYEQENNVTLSGQLLLPVKPITSPLLSANLLVDFGNSTYRWENNTAIQAGWNAYTFTLIATSGQVNATWYPQYGEHFVTGIEGVPQTSTEFWFLWSYDGGAWQLSQTGPDQVTVLNGTSIAWTLCAENMTTYLPTCTPH